MHKNNWIIFQLIQPGCISMDCPRYNEFLKDIHFPRQLPLNVTLPQELVSLSELGKQRARFISRYPCTAHRDAIARASRATSLSKALQWARAISKENHASFSPEGGNKNRTVTQSSRRFLFFVVPRSLEDSSSLPSSVFVLISRSFPLSQSLPLAVSNFKANFAFHYCSSLCSHLFFPRPAFSL